MKLPSSYRPDWLSACSALCALLITCMAVMIMIRWIGQDNTMVDEAYPFKPMQFNTAVCFLLYSLAFLGLRGTRILSLLAIGLGLSLSLLTTFEYMSGASIGIDTLFIRPFFVSDLISPPGRMPANCALGLVLTGSALICCAGINQLSHRRALAAALLGSLVITTGTVPILGYLFNIQTAYDAGGFAHMSIYSGLSFCLLGTLIVAYSWQKTDNTLHWLPIPVFISIMVVTYFMSEAVRQQEEIKFEDTLQVEANHIAQDAELHLLSFYRALDRIGDRWNAAGGTPRVLWEKDAQAYIRDYPFLAGLSKADTDARIEWIIPASKNNKAMGFKLDSEPKRAEAVAAALKQHKGQTTRIVELLGGGSGFLYIVPLYSGRQYQGLQVGVMRVQQIFDALLTRTAKDNFYVSAEERDGHLFYSNVPAGHQEQSSLHKSAIVHNKDAVWNVIISPTPKLLATRNSLIPAILMGVGALCAMLVMLSILLMLKWRHNAQVLRLREHALEEKTEEQAKLIAIIEESPDFVGVADLEGNLQYHNRSSRRMMGYPEDYDLSKMKIDDVHPRWASKIIADQGIATAFAKGSWQGETALLHKDGHEIPVLQNIILLRDIKGAAYCTTTIMRDISDRKKAEILLQQSEEQFRSAMEYAPIGKALVSPDGRWLQVNKRLCDLVGYSKDELLSSDFQNITHPDDLKEDLEFVKRMLERKIQTYQMEKRYFHKDGHIIWVLLSVSLVWDAAGRPRYFISQIQDITERKKAEEDLRQSESFNRSLMQASPDCIKILDTRGRLLSMNSPGECIMEIDDFGPLCGKEWWTLWPEETQAEVRKSVEIAASGQQYRFQAFCPTAKGTPKWWDVQISPVTNSNGEIIHLLSVSRDITESKEIERIKNEFISTVSHELRTPLTSIRGSLGLLLGGVAGKLEEKNKSLIGIAYKNCERLVLLINDILDIEKIESGQMQYDMKPEDVKDIIAQSVMLNRAYGEKLSVRFVLQEPMDTATIMVDSGRMLQVLANLLSNAAKFSPPGSGVEISTHKTSAHIRVCVTDKGPGISEEFKKRIFRKFVQADSSDSRQKGGTGLGLTITRAIIERMGGTIGFTTEEGKGATFHFDLPILRNTSEPPILLARKASGRPKILICEDDGDIAHLLSISLSNAGFDTDIAGSAGAAREFIRSGGPYAAMTLDLILPDMDGLMFLRALREQDAVRSLPVIVISGKVDEATEKFNGLALGVVDYLRKPIDIERLMRAVRSVVVAADKAQILHVEDDEDIVKVLSFSVKDIATVTRASSLAQARDLMQKKAFDLIILDVGLPDGSGLEVLRILKQNGASVPVIIFSADEMPEEVSAKVAASLTKSKSSGDRIVSTITTLISKMRKAG